MKKSVLTFVLTSGEVDDAARDGTVDFGGAAARGTVDLGGATARRRPSRAARIRLHRMRTRAVYALAAGPSPERTRLWRAIFESEGRLVKMIAQSLPDEPNLAAGASLLDQYRGVRRLERCLERATKTGSRALLVVGDGPIGDRLAELLGVDDLRDVAEPTDLLTDDEAEGGRSAATLRARAAALQTRRRIVIACGRVAAMAFRLDDAPFFEWREVGWNGSRAAVVVVPHPSGRNRWWNDDENRAAAERFFRLLGGRLRLALSAPPRAADPGGRGIADDEDDAVDKNDEKGDNGAVGRNLRANVPEDVGEAIDRICEEAGISPNVWLRALAIREVRMLGSMTGGAIYGCVCGHRRSEHHRDRDRDGEFYGTCVECTGCVGYQQAPPPQKKGTGS